MRCIACIEKSSYRFRLTINAERMFGEITFDIILRSVLYSPITSYDDERQSKKNLTRGNNKQINTRNIGRAAG